MKQITGVRIIFNFLPFLWRDKSFTIRLGLIIAILLVPFTIILNLILPVIFKNVVNEINNKNITTEFTLISLIFSYSVLWTMQTCIEKIREMLFFRPISHAITDYSMAVFKHLHSLNLRFHLIRETGNVTTAIDSCQRALATVFTNTLFRIVPAALEIIIAVIIIGCLYGTYYVFILVVTILTFIILFVSLFNRIIDKLGDRWSTLEGIITSKFVDSLLNIETVKYFNRTDYETNNAIALGAQSTNLAVKIIASLSGIQIFLTCIIAIGFGIITYHAVTAVLNHQLMLGDYILISSYVILFIAPMYSLALLASDTRFYITKIAPAVTLLANSQYVEPGTNLPSLKISNGEINVDKVSFNYLPGLPILKNLVFTIPPGSTFAIVGPSGSGKSTIAKLLLRLFDPTCGTIKVDNQRIENCNPNSVRQAIACVPQDIALFNDTLRFNICYGTFDCDDDNLTRILRITELDNFIQKLPDGLSTQVGERGLKLSGGEKQRVALARALLKRAKILVLDEATSSLDVNTERAINNNLATISHAATTLIIAHRLSTIVNADQIIVIDQGSIVEQGTHHDLFKFKGLYAALWHQQLERSEQYKK